MPSLTAPALSDACELRAASQTAADHFNDSKSLGKPLFAGCESFSRSARGAVCWQNQCCSVVILSFQKCTVLACETRRATVRGCNRLREVTGALYLHIPRISPLSARKGSVSCGGLSVFWLSGLRDSQLRSSPEVLHPAHYSSTGFWCTPFNHLTALCVIHFYLRIAQSPDFLWIC